MYQSKQNYLLKEVFWGEQSYCTISISIFRQFQLLDHFYSGGGWLGWQEDWRPTSCTSGVGISTWQEQERPGKH